MPLVDVRDVYPGCPSYDDSLVNWAWINSVESVQGCEAAIAQLRRNWRTALENWRWAATDTIWANQFAFFHRYKMMGGQALQIGDMNLNAIGQDDSCSQSVNPRSFSR